MDEEDLADAAEAQRLQTSESFAGLGLTEGDQMRKDFVMNVFRAEGDTMGVKLLRKMGWRDGQGVGPKVRRKARLGGHNGGDGETEEESRLFAPENSALIKFTRKSDRKGLGYDGEARLEGKNGLQTADQLQRANDDEETEFRITSKPLKSKRSGASSKSGFGVGILNDTGSDDEDPYEMGPKISYNKVIGGNKKKQQKPSGGGRSGAGAANPLLGSKPVFISKKASSSAGLGFRRCHDGRLPLDGFLLSIDTDAPSPLTDQEKTYAPPEIPKDWKSTKQPTSGATSVPYQSAADAAKASTLNPNTRASILGESQLSGKSVFDYLSPAARNRVAAASGKQDLPSGLGEAAPKGFSVSEEERQRDLLRFVPELDKEVATKALGKGIAGWMPYAEDDVKRMRYRAFLEYKAGLRGQLSFPEPGISRDDWLKELHEFAHAAQIFKPMTGLMASRFTSSSSQPQSVSEKAASTQTASSSSDPTNTLLRGPSGKPEDPAEAAAKVGMYGPMTRSVQTFYPTRLLCKRFNVKPPSHVHADPSTGDAGTKGTAGMGEQNKSQCSHGDSTALPSKSLELVSSAALNDILRDSETSHKAARSDQAPEDVKPPPEYKQALEVEKPGEAVFKAIFGSDAEDDDEG